jgi:hypothetical protein
MELGRRRRRRLREEPEEPGAPAEVRKSIAAGIDEGER